jgi:myo-inositol catabolism protein IolS
MKFKQFSNSKLNLSVLGMGCGAISGEGGGYGFGEISHDQAMELIKYAYQRGINVFDTAPIYGFGLSEKRLGEAVKTFREKIFIISKSGVTWHSNKRVDMNNDPKIAKRMLEQSLKDLNSDYIDLYMVHWPDDKFDIRHTLEVYFKAQLSGKIKYIGLCNTHLDDLVKAKELGRIDALQSEFSLLNNQSFELMREHIESDQMSLFGWGTLDKGILSGTVSLDRLYDESDCRRSAAWFKKDVKPKLEKVSQLKKIIKEKYDLKHMALQYSLQYPLMTSALVGMKSLSQIDEMIDLSLKPIDYNEIENYLIELNHSS